MKIASAFEQFAMRFQTQEDPDENIFTPKLTPPSRQEIQFKVVRYGEEGFSDLIDNFTNKCADNSYGDILILEFPSIDNDSEDEDDSVDPYWDALSNKTTQLSEKIYHALDSAMPWEKTFFVFTLPYSQQASLFLALRRHGYPFFFQQKIEDATDHRISFPNTALEQIFRKALNPEGNEVVYGFGELKPRDIEHFQLQRKTPVNIVCGPFSFLSEEQYYTADDHWAGPLGFMIHDLYHAWRKAGYPLNHVLAINRIITVLRMHLNDSSFSASEKIKQNVKRFIWSLVDGELFKNFDGTLPFTEFLKFYSKREKGKAIEDVETFEVILETMFKDFDENPKFWENLEIPQVAFRFLSPRRRS